MNHLPGQKLARGSRAKKSARVRPRKRNRVVSSILGDAKRDPYRYVSGWVVNRGAE